MTSQGVISIDTDEESRDGTSWVELDTRSLTESIRGFQYSNGRRFNNYRFGEYMLPNDEAEQDRMDILHFIWKSLLDGAIMQTNLTSPTRILDIGTGTGSWALEAADQYPSATIIGTDISPIQPSYVPENCYFVISDAEASNWDWDRDEDRFDFIHARSLCGSIKDWPRFYQQCLESLVPGGQIEVQEHVAWITCAPSGRIPPWIAQWNIELNAAFWSWGKGLNIADRHAQWMRDAGFVDVNEQVQHIPIGPWAKDPRLKELGKWLLVQMLAAVDSYTLEVYTRVLGKDIEETKIAIEMIKSELRGRRNHLIGRFYVITGKKPKW